MATNKSDVRAARAAAHEKPSGQCRMHAFPSEIRGHLVEHDGKSFYEVDGYATVFSRAYEMWDMFGSYQEQIAPDALDDSLAAGPDVAFLVNHRGVTMARTKNSSLDLTKDALGLRIHAFLNPERQDVRDLISAMGDKLVDEMSFAFMLNDGEWNTEYDEFTITSADINRGDVSAVNYGANPYTSIAARAAEWLSSLDHMPDAVVRAAFDRYAANTGIPEVSPQASADREADETAEPKGHRAVLALAQLALNE
jgi:HK97 family phage prohead protease